MTSNSSNSSSSNNSEGDAIQVFVRVRPPDRPQNDIDTGTCVHVDEDNHSIIVHCKPDPKVFTFDQVADINASQESVFSSVGKRIIESAVAGYNGTIFAYGQTGSGKTFTMMGPSDECDDFHHPMRGVIPRAFDYLFNLVQRNREMHGQTYEFLCKCSFLEIYNEQVFDLLDPTSAALQLRENMKRGVFVEGLTENVANSAADAYEVLNQGWMNRRVAATSMNRESSRSHAVFTVSIDTKQKKEGIQNVKMSQLHLVDLAGSERQKDTHTTGIRLKEAGSINKSLSVLGHVIMVLVDIAHGKSRYVPYRDSKLSFLLRDSLGGNAKTCIIACVHPGSRCFGETLSALQFARRAKMIKNKAVVNEDTQGNLQHLQAEIKRLKELLAQSKLTQELTPKCPENNAVIPVIKVDEEKEHKEGREYKTKFLDAMYFRERIIQENKNLQEKMSKLEDQCNKREKFLQSTKMIVKFRENHITRLEKSLKEAKILDEDNEKMSLKEEIKVLKNQLDHNPMITKYAVENQNLRREIKKLRTQESVVNGIRYEEQLVQQLEKCYRDILAETQGKDGKECPDLRRASMTPNCTPQNENQVSIATIEKYKSQISSLQGQVETQKQELQEQKNVSEKQVLDLTSELASQQKSVRELEQVLEAHHIKSKIEREALNDMHMQAIKTITTPTKVAYTLRNRDVVRNSMGGGPVPFDLTLEEEDIMDEAEPAQMTEQAHEALTEEIKQLQKQSCDLNQKLKEQESEMLKLKQVNSKLDHQNEQLNEIISKERSEWNETQRDLTNQVTKLSDNLQVVTSAKSMLDSENCDLKVLISSADRELDVIRAQNKEIKSNHEKDIETMKLKLIQVESECNRLQKDFDTLLEEKEMLQESLDTAYSTNTFNEDRIKELEHLMMIDRKSLQDLEMECQGLQEKLNQERERMAHLKEEFNQQGQDKENALVRAVEENQLQQQQSLLLQNSYDSLNEKMVLLCQDKEELCIRVGQLQKAKAEDKEVVNMLMTRVQEQKAELTSQEERLSEAMSQLQMQENQCRLQEETENDLRTSLEEWKKLQEEMASNAEMQANELRNEIEQLKDESEQTAEQLTDTQSLLVQTQSELEERGIRLEQMQEELDSRIEELDQVRSNYVNTLKEVEDEGKQKEDLSEKLHSLQNELREVKAERESLKGFVVDSEHIRMEKNEEIKLLKVQLQENKNEMNEYEKKNNELCAGLRFERDQNEAMKQQSQKLSDSVGRIKEALDETTDKLSVTLSEKDKLQKNLELKEANLEMNEDILQEKCQDVERLQNLAKKDQEEISILASTVEQHFEEKSKLEKDLKEFQERLAEAQLENAKLVGHQNIHQKIQYHYQIKQENCRLKEEVQRLSTELVKFKPKKAIESTLKETFKHNKMGDQNVNC